LFLGFALLPYLVAAWFLGLVVDGYNPGHKKSPSKGALFMADRWGKLPSVMFLHFKKEFHHFDSKTSNS